MKKDDLGITLISLTITIMVMIVLSAILIRTTGGLGKAQEIINGTENIYETNKAEVEEKIHSIDNKWKNVLNKNTIDNVID